MTYFLQHKRDTWQHITCANRAQAIATLYRQWRDMDGSIPWRVMVRGCDGDVWEISAP